MFSFSPFLGLSFVHSFIKLINISIAKDVFLKYSQQQFRHLLTRLIPPLSLSLSSSLSLQIITRISKFHQPRTRTSLKHYWLYRSTAYRVWDYFFLGDDWLDAFLLGDCVVACFFGVPPLEATIGRAFSELSDSSSLELDRTSPSIWKGKWKVEGEML